MPLLEEYLLHILFVCTGNICRSPTAERLTIALAAEHGISTLSASSAGIRAVVGHPVHPDAADVLNHLGGDASGFAARRLTPRIASDANLIVTMTYEHRDSVLALAPQCLRRTFTIAEVAHLVADLGAQSISDLTSMRPQLAGRRLRDIPDPIGQSAEYFAKVGIQISEMLVPVVSLFTVE